MSVQAQGDNPPELTSDEHRLLGKLPPVGTNTTNPTLIQSLHWSHERYYAVRDRLLDLGLVEIGRGRGGVVRRPAPPATVEGALAAGEPEAAVVQEALAKERDLYGPMRDVIAGEWSSDHRVHPLAVEITASQGRRETGGRYTRPDITAVEVRSYRYLPSKTLEIITFEVKPQVVLDVTCVYEALAHRAAATMSYVLLHVPQPNLPQAELDAIEAAAASQGIGMIVAGSPSHYETWETRVKAIRQEPEPQRLDDFIHTQLSEKARDLILRAIR